MAEDGAISFTISHEGGNGAPKSFTLRQGEEKAIRIGRAPGNDILVEHRGVSQYHAEVRLVEGGRPRLCVRDLSMNGTGLKRTEEDNPVHCTKKNDEAVPDGAVLLIPMLLKANAERAWLRVQYLTGEEAIAAAAAAPRAAPAKRQHASKASAHKPAAAAEPPADGEGTGSEQDEDTEKNRVRFVELLLKSREVSAGTKYETARDLLSSNAAWHAVDEATRRECFDIFVEHLGNHQSSKKEKKKDKDKKKKRKHDGAEEEPVSAGAPPKKEKKRKGEKARGGSDDEPDRDRRKGKGKKEASDRRSKSRERARGGAREGGGGGRHGRRRCDSGD